MPAQYSADNRSVATHGARQIGFGKARIVHRILYGRLCHSECRFLKHLQVNAIIGSDPMPHTPPPPGYSLRNSLYNSTACSISRFSLSVFPDFCLTHPLKSTRTTFFCSTTSLKQYNLWSCSLNSQSGFP